MGKHRHVSIEIGYPAILPRKSQRSRPFYYTCCKRGLRDNLGCGLACPSRSAPIAATSPRGASAWRAGCGRPCLPFRPNPSCSPPSAQSQQERAQRRGVDRIRRKRACGSTSLACGPAFRQFGGNAEHDHFVDGHHRDVDDRPFSHCRSRATPPSATKADRSTRARSAASWERVRRYGPQNRPEPRTGGFASRRRRLGGDKLDPLFTGPTMRLTVAAWPHLCSQAAF
jgi:hypothetical protein